MMKNFLCCSLIFAAVVAASQTTEQKLSVKNSKIKQELIKLEEEWHNAYLKRDAAPLERILADEYIAVGATAGASQRKQSKA